jgi:hypothetical protein
MSMKVLEALAISPNTPPGIRSRTANPSLSRSATGTFRQHQKQHSMNTGTPRLFLSVNGLVHD